MGKRRRAREIAIQVLFHLEFNPEQNPEQGFRLLCENFRFAEFARPFSKALVLGVSGAKAMLDPLIAQASRHWRVERMNRVDRCILRLAAYEMLFMKDIPPKVSIDEAVELAKRYGGEDSASFVNGVLDKIYSSLERDPGPLEGRESGDCPPAAISQ
jgi:transcription antitermination factor NusB